MRKAILYIRVSTDEQADKGYSLQHQEERLRKYCEMQNIQVTDLYQDDYSAKTFNRPEFTRLLNGLKKHRARADLLLFTKWDRFSRNTGDAYGMINTLGKLGIDPQAIEQPLDLEIPENKIMLAFYLAAPEVENDRRALNVFVGMRRAKKEGRWMATAPKGYKNIHNEEGKPVIIPSKDAPVFKLAFEELAKGVLNVEEVRKLCKGQGLDCSKNNFWKQIRNPVYCGKIQIPAYKDEEAHIVQGTHEPIISVDLFEKVQDILTGRQKKKVAYHGCAKEELPLRGFLVCPRCGRKLTGSASTGGSGLKNFYYHCTNGCKERIKAFPANDTFSDFLKTFVFKEEVQEIYREIMADIFNTNSDEKHFSQKQLQDEIQRNRERVNSAQQMMLDGSISPQDYKEIKARYDPIIDRLVRQHLDGGLEAAEFKKYLKKGLQLLKSLGQVYDTAHLAMKQEIIRSICKENLRFEENRVRTGKINRLIHKISQFCKGYSLNENGTEDQFDLQSHWVIPLGLEPRTPTLKVLCSTN
jgi:site-specific DNA recombinase